MPTIHVFKSPGVIPGLGDTASFQMTVDTISIVLMTVVPIIVTHEEQLVSGFLHSYMRKMPLKVPKASIGANIKLKVCCDDDQRDQVELRDMVSLNAALFIPDCNVNPWKVIERGPGYFIIQNFRYQIDELKIVL